MFVRIVTKVDVARSIGEHYLENHPTKNPFHSNQDIAKKLTELKQNLSDQHLQKILLVYYFSLPNAFGHMAKALRHFFALHLQQPYLLINNYSVAKINKIGSDYLDEYPEGGIRIFSHTQQDIAIKLKIYQHPHKIDRIKPEEVIRRQWQFLLDTFRDVKPGRISQQIENIFVEVFEINLADPDTAKKFIDRKIEKALATLPKPDDIQLLTPAR